MAPEQRTTAGRAAAWLLDHGAHVLVIVLALYAITLMPGVPATDSGELALAAWLPGVAHAPGFPSYTLAAFLWSHILPGGRVITRLNLLSAVAGAAACTVVYILVSGTLAERPRSHRILAATAAGLGLAAGYTVWTWSVVTEVYAVNLLVSAAILALLLAATRADRPIAPVKAPAAGRRGAHSPAPIHARATPGLPRVLPLAGAGFLFGLGLGLHLTSVVLLAPAIAVWLTLHYGVRVWRSTVTLWAALALLAGLATYLYLPLAASTEPLLSWGQPDSVSRFVSHVTARQYRVSLFSAPVWPQIQLAARLWWTQFSPLGLAFIVIGAVATWRKHRRLFWLVLVIVAAVTLYAWAYVIEDDQDAYYLPVFLAAAIWLGWGVAAAFDWLREKVVQGRGALAAALLAAVVVLPLLMNWSGATRQSDTIPEDYVLDVLEETPQDALLLTRDWQFYSPSLYLQHVEGLRPDVTIVDTELLRRDWYFALLHRVDPGFFPRMANEESAYRQLRDAWEQGQIPEGDPRINDLQQAYVAYLDALIREAGALGRPVRAGPSRGAPQMRSATLQGMPDLEAGAGAQWQWLPTGLTFAALDPGEPQPAVPPLDWRIEAFDRVAPLAPEEKIRATRADMATVTGLYRANAGDLPGAEADWRLAIKIDPSYAPALELLGRLGVTLP